MRNSSDLIEKLVETLKEEIENKNQSRSEIKNVIDYIYREIYHDDKNPAIISPHNFFYIITVDKFFVEQNQSDSNLINYLSDFIYRTTNTPMHIFSDEADMLLTLDPINTSLSHKDKASIYRTIGDQCLFKSGTVRYFYDSDRQKQKKNKSSFEEIGKKAYFLAGEEINDLRQSGIFSTLSQDFKIYVNGIESIAKNHLFGYPNNIFVKRMIEYSKRYSKNPTKQNKQSARMFRELVNRHLADNNSKYL